MPTSAPCAPRPPGVPDAPDAHQRRRRFIALAVSVQLSTAAVAGCALIPPAPSTAPAGPVSSVSPRPGTAEPGSADDGADDGAADFSAGPSAAEVRQQGVPVNSGAVALWVLGDAVTLTTMADGSVAVSAAVPADTPTVAHIAVADGLVAAELMDGSVVLRDDAGVAVGGLTAPVLAAPPLDAPGGLPATSARLQVSPDLIDLAVSPVSTSAAVTVTVRFGTAAIASTEWGDREGGRSLAVVPTDWLRTGALAAQEAGWAALVGSVPEADTATMRDQFDCHALGALDKASWNLEPWRPDVGALAVLGARCNPT